MHHVFCIGELLIDFVCLDIHSSLTEGNHFEKKAGGAPANVAAAITKLGGYSSFMGQVGNDPFGALTCTNYGAIASLPTLKDVEAYR